MQANDTELSAALFRCACKEKPAFVTLYNNTSALLFRMIRRIVLDDDIAHDVLQKGYLVIWNKAGQFNDEKGRALTWMIVIMRNQAIDEWRRQQREPRNEELHDLLPDPSALPDARCDQALVGGVLERELRRLPEKMAFAIRSRFILGKTVSEIAEVLSVSVNTVKSWITRGLARLKRALPFDNAEAGLFVG